MNAERLLEVYEQISEAPDAVAQLRRFVLDLAVRGKLIEQCTADEPASKLLSESLAAKKEAGVKHKSDPVLGEDIPFPAPSGWIWTRIGEISLQTGSGSTPRGGKSAYADNGTPFLRSQNIYDDGLRLDDVVFINDETNTKMKRTQVKAKDLLLNITGGSIGRCCRIPNEFDIANVSQHVAIIRTAARDTQVYLHLLIRSPFFQEYVLGEQTGAGRGGLPKNRMDRIPVPLPPLAEQHRIAARVDELMGLCDRLEEARKTREETRDKLTAASFARLTAPETSSEEFPAHAQFALDALPSLTSRRDQIKTLRQTILNLAVHGKLVKQVPADEPAIDLMNQAKAAKLDTGVKYKPDPIEETAIPFSVPSGWAWTRIGEIALQTGSGSTPRGGKSAYANVGTPFLRSQNIYDDGLRLDDVVFINNETNQRMKRTHVKAKDLLLNITGGSIGRCCRIPDEFDGANVSQHVAIIRTAAKGTEDYLHLLARSPFFQEYVMGEQTGAGRGGLPKNRMDRIPVPLPPLKEQSRILAKVGALMELCDVLEAALTTADTNRTRLIEALLHEALEPGSDAE